MELTQRPSGLAGALPVVDLVLVVLVPERPGQWQGVGGQEQTSGRLPLEQG